MNYPADDLVILKHQVDWLFYREQYEEACQRVRCMLDTLVTGATGTRRELFEAILECALKASDTELVQQMYTYLASIRVEDSSLAYVLTRASVYLGKLGDSHNDHHSNEDNNDNDSNRKIP